MRYAQELSGDIREIVRRFRTGVTTTPGTFLLAAGAGNAGLQASTTTSLADAVGLVNDAVTYSTTQGSAAADVAVTINPFGVYEARLSGGAAAGTQLGVWTNSSASTAGTVVTITTGEAAPNSPTMDEGFLYNVTGANGGGNPAKSLRKITAVAATTATVTDPYDNDIAVGDLFIYGPFFPGDGPSSSVIQLCTELTEFDASAATSGDAEVRILELVVDATTLSAARRKTVARFLLDDSIFARNT